MKCLSKTNYSLPSTLSLSLPIRAGTTTNHGVGSYSFFWGKLGPDPVTPWGWFPVSGLAKFPVYVTRVTVALALGMGRATISGSGLGLGTWGGICSGRIRVEVPGFPVPGLRCRRYRSVRLGWLCLCGGWGRTGIMGQWLVKYSEEVVKSRVNFRGGLNKEERRRLCRRN